MPNTTQPTIYFSIDYRSPPSGMGQIVDTSQPEKIGDKWNMINVDYGTDDSIYPDYIKTRYFYSEIAAQEGWAGPVMPDIIQYLRDQGVTHVYDSEISCEFDGADDKGYFTIDRWSQIMIQQCADVT
jgi:hypothetical protein